MSDVNSADEALAHCHIMSLLSLYYHALEGGDFTTLAEHVMAPDAVWDVVQHGPSGSHRYVSEGRDTVIAWFAKLMSPGGISRGAVRQYLSTHVITVNGDTAHSVSNLQAVKLDTMSLLASGKAEADHIKTDRGWRIRRFRLDERMNDASMGAGAVLAAAGDPSSTAE